jgi:hypothetical protein
MSASEQLFNEFIKKSFGLNVFVSELDTVIGPARKSKNKRLQKKFIKKYGMINKP